jgi:hypothetical protein
MLHSLSLAAFDARRGLQGALCMKRKREKRQGCREDDPCYPETADIHGLILSHLLHAFSPLRGTKVAPAGIEATTRQICPFV